MFENVMKFGLYIMTRAAPQAIPPPGPQDTIILFHRIEGILWESNARITSSSSNAYMVMFFFNFAENVNFA